MNFHADFSVLGKDVELVLFLDGLKVDSTYDIVFVFSQMSAQFFFFQGFSNNKLNLFLTSHLFLTN